MVCGVPRMCMRMQVQPRSARVGSMALSRWPAEMSLMMSAPAAMAARATGAWYVSTLMARGEKVGSARMARMVGRMRVSSSSGGMGVALGRVDCPPMSRIVGGCLLWVRWDLRVERRGEGLVREWVSPSEKESGVKLRTAIKWVRFVGRSVVIGGKEVESGVCEERVASVFGRLCSWSRKL